MLTAPRDMLNAVDQLRARAGAGSDAALARMLGVSGSAVSRWRQRNRVPASATNLPDRAPAITKDDLRKGVALLPADERRVFVLELMAGILGK